MSHAGSLIVLSAPSGGGKTTVARAILQRHPDMKFSVSATTRAKRPNEVHGREYFFLTVEEFEAKIARGEFAEWERFFDTYYGTLKDQVEAVLNGGGSMLFDVDVKGALSIKRLYPEESLLIFLEPPSKEVLFGRLRNRNTEDAAALEKRFARAEMELNLASSFDRRVTNDDLTRVITEVDALVAAHLTRTSVKN